MKNKKRFKEWMTALHDKFEKEISEFMAKAIWQEIKPFDDEACEKAFQFIFSHGRFFKDILPDLLDRLEGSQSDQAALAWLKVDWAATHLGPWASVRFDDSVIHSTIESMGGWVKFQDVDISEWKWVRKEFERLYQIKLKMNQSGPAYLIGEQERDNRAKGFENYIQAPINCGTNSKGIMFMIKEGKDREAIPLLKNVN